MRVTVRPRGYVSLQSDPQLIPKPVTRPCLDVTVRVTAGSKSAVTVVAVAGTNTEHADDVELRHGPAVQRSNSEPLAGVAVSATNVACGNVPEHVLPHAIPAGELVTEPLPEPASVTVTGLVGLRANAAVAVTGLAPR